MGATDAPEGEGIWVPGINALLVEAMGVPGARGAALVDWTCGFALDSAGEWPMEDPEAAAVEAAELARLVAESAVFASRRRESGHMPEAGRAAEPGPIPDRPTSVEDLIVTNGTGYHLLRFVESAPGSSPFVHLWLDRDTSNLALARLRLQDLAGRLGQGLVRQGPR